ncbi:hypothetical protein ACFX2I_045504 [Malus domestica]
MYAAVIHVLTVDVSRTLQVCFHFDLLWDCCHVFIALSLRLQMELKLLLTDPPPLPSCTTSNRITRYLSPIHPIMIPPNPIPDGIEASAKAGHPTYFLVRETTLSNPKKSKFLENLKDLGFNFVLGDLYDYESLVKAIEQVDVVISTVGHAQLADQATHAIELTWVMCFEKECTGHGNSLDLQMNSYAAWRDETTMVVLVPVGMNIIGPYFWDRRQRLRYGWLHII